MTEKRKANSWLAVKGICAGVGAIAAFAIGLIVTPLPLTGILWLCALGELAFAVHYVLLCWELYPNSVHLRLPTDYDPQVTKYKLMRHLIALQNIDKRVDDIKQFMMSWFVNAQSWDDIKRQNLKELFAYAIWYKTIEQLQAEGMDSELEELLTELEHHLGRKVPEGYNTQLKFMCHLWEPLRHFYRPLVFYVVMELLAWLCHAMLIAAGFRLHKLRGISYYTFNLDPQQHAEESRSKPLNKQQCSMKNRTAAQNMLSAAAAPCPASAADVKPPATQLPAAEADAGSLPLVFLHGVGAGLLPYLALVFHLATQGRPMILPESKHVSMRLVSWLPTVDDMADATAAIMAAHGVRKAAVMAHSYGTMVAARLVLKYQPLVHSLCLMDPVCFAMFMPNLLRNFLYTRHNSGCFIIDVIMMLVSTELNCARSFSRQFFWTSINLWDEHIPPRTLVVLSGRDILSPTAQVHTWLQDHTHAQVLYKPEMPHAGVLVNINWQATVFETFAQVMKRPVGSPAAAAAVAAAEGPHDSAADVVAAAEGIAQQQTDEFNTLQKAEVTRSAVAVTSLVQKQHEGAVTAKVVASADDIPQQRRDVERLQDADHSTLKMKTSRRVFAAARASLLEESAAQEGGTQGVLDAQCGTTVAVPLPSEPQHESAAAAAATIGTAVQQEGDVHGLQDTQQSSSTVPISQQVAVPATATERTGQQKLSIRLCEMHEGAIMASESVSTSSSSDISTDDCDINDAEAWGAPCLQDSARSNCTTCSSSDSKQQGGYSCYCLNCQLFPYSVDVASDTVSAYCDAAIEVAAVAGAAADATACEAQHKH